MPLETAQYIEQLNPTWPLGTDQRAQGDDHIRLLKAAMQGSLPNTNGAWKTTNEISGGGFDAQNKIVRQVAAPQAPTDAARKQETDNLATLIAAIAISSFGYIWSDGNKVIGSNDFTSVRSGAGVYVITWTTAASVQHGNLCVVTVGWQTASDAVSAHYVNLAANKTEVRILVNGAPTDAGFTLFRMRK